LKQRQVEIEEIESVFLDVQYFGLRATLHAWKKKVTVATEGNRRIHRIRSASAGASKRLNTCATGTREYDSKPHLVNHVILEACNYSDITG